MKNCKIMALTLMLSACSSVVTPYPPKINPSIEKLSQNTLSADTTKAYKKEQSSRDEILFNMELGRLSQLKGDLKQSIKYYKNAIEDVKDDEEKALVSVGDISSQIGATIVNDNVISYTGKPFEHIMLHTNQALNYLFNKDIENAAPEIRLAGDNQQKALENNQKAIDDAKEKEELSSEKLGIATKFIKDNFTSFGIDEVAGKVKNEFQNAYAFYISGIVYELHGEKEDAYLDYKNALEMMPQNAYFQKDVIRLAKELGHEEELEGLKKKFSSSYKCVEANKNNSNFIVLIEDGFVTQKEEVKFALPVDLKGGLVNVNFPVLKKAKYVKPSIFTVSDNGKNLGSASLATDFDVLSFRSFKDSLLGIVTRSIIREGTRVAAQYGASKIKDGVGSTFAKLGLFAADNKLTIADLRGWYTLPSNAQVLSANLPVGTHNITIKNSDGKKVDIKVNVEDGKKSIVRVIKAGNSYYTQEVTL